MSDIELLNQCMLEAVELLVMIPGGPLVFQTGYHPRKRTFKTHPKHVFFKYENRP